MTRKRDELLDHDADGIREFDNDLPKWWLYGFYFTIVVAALYLVNYHVLPTPLFGAKTVAAEWEADMREAAVRFPARSVAAAGSAPMVARLTGEGDLAKGKAIFESQTHPCAACHRPDLGGLVGPNLTDEYWLHGCSVGQITQTIKTGYPAKGMVPYGGGPPLSDPELQQLASYILSKGDSHPPSPKAKDALRDVECEQEGH